MEVILKQDVYNIGHKDEVVNVKSGYARNYLIPKGFAMVASKSNKKMLEETQKQRSFKEEKAKKEAETIAESIKKLDTIKIGAKAGTSGKIFGSVNAFQIAEALKNQKGIEVDRKKIMVNGENIKELGEYTAQINLHKDVSVDLKFEVIGE